MKNGYFPSKRHENEDVECALEFEKVWKYMILHDFTLLLSYAPVIFALIF